MKLVYKGIKKTNKINNHNSKLNPKARKFYKQLILTVMKIKTYFNKMVYKTSSISIIYMDLQILT